ncbi:MAG TPA: hypothetical protein VND93_20305 [Myxococcales bacterium]|nr:hypothetical protein [Myxococcales bacterium]
MSRRLAVRLPLLAALAVGLWLWQSSLFPQPRELLLRLPSRGPPLTRAELQLYAEGGELLKREERSFPGGGAPDQLRVEIALKRGRYLCRLFVEDASGGKRQLSRTVEVGDERTYELEPDAR